MKRLLLAVAIFAILFLSSCAPSRVAVGVGTRPYYGVRPYYNPRPFYNPYYYRYSRPWGHPHYRGYYGNRY
ncbi:MAG: hypothetical protein ACR2FN_11680 [Chitinophagaceae bacterium]